jgi:hypothetical protein
VALRKYVRSAFMNHWNLLLLGAGTVFAFLTGRPDVILPFVVAGEIAYLGLLGTHPKFQRYVEAQEAKEKQETGQRSTAATFARITAGLPPAYLNRYEALRKRCLDLRQIAMDLHQRGPETTGSTLEQMQLAGLDRLLWIYLRLLHTSWSLERFFERTGEGAIRADIERLTQRVAEFAGRDLDPREEKVRAALTDNLNTSQARLDNLRKAHENHELMQLELDRLENKIRTISEIAVNRQEPEFISDQVDAVAGSMLETERTMNELQFATGLTAAETAVPELLTRELAAEEPAFGERAQELEPPPLPRSRYGRGQRKEKELEG